MWLRVDKVLPNIHISNIEAVSVPPRTIVFFLLHKDRQLPILEYARMERLLPNLRKFKVDIQLPHLLILRTDNVLPVELTLAIEIKIQPPM